MREPQCGVCDLTSSSLDKRHSISNAIDGTNRWWQSPTLQNGRQYQWITITLDLRQIYQIAYIIIKAAISPRPGNWILERSVDGVNYQPWQYYAISDTECWHVYGIRPTTGKPRYRSDNEVICTSYYSKLNPLENGEIHTSLVNGRPGAEGPTDILREFTSARYIRMRLQKIRTLNADLMTLQTNDPERIDKTVTRRYFYSIKDISIGGQCVCYGHARDCPRTSTVGKQQCRCEHNTCGENCNYCCPLYNQKTWRPGNSTDGAVCEECQCYGHSTRCHYDQNVADKRTSINIDGVYEGGGVCESCQHNTAGINCEQCADGFYRPRNVRKDNPSPCRPCQCHETGMTGLCVKDDSHISEGLRPGECLCKEGFTGKKCNKCDKGYRNFPLCEPCPCHFAGTVDNTTCEGKCICKVNVEGARCDKCKDGYYHLSADNPDGCSACFCFGVTNRCRPSDWGKEIVTQVQGWLVTSLDGRRIVYPTAHKKQFMIANDDMASYDNYYWLAPDDYIGKKLYSYGGELKFSISYIIARGDTSGHYTEDPDVILEGTNRERLGYSWGIHPEEDTVTITMPLREQGWYLLSETGSRASPVSRETFTIVLNNIRRLLIRAKFHTDQVECTMKDVGLEIASETSTSLKKMTSVEKCICPPGYTGLSCELCSPGYRRINSTLPGGICERCDCHNHAESCDPVTGRCQNCLYNTGGTKCEQCLPGYYGDARIGTPGDCKRCACPLEDQNNNFSPTCQAVFTASGTSDYICSYCAPGYEGDKCERCSEGYFGSPIVLGGYCQPCECSNNVDTSHPGYCDRVTGQCLKCLGNTGGWNCGECLDGHYGNAERQDCRPCDCDRYGSLLHECDKSTGQCHCKPNYIGRRCERCEERYGNVMIGCIPCVCNSIGARSESCDPVSGRCICKPGVFGTTCDSCLENYYGFSQEGCRACECNLLGSTHRQCDETSGQCQCKQHVIGRTCDRCQPGYWNIASNNGCEQCICNSSGIISPACDEATGQCSCKRGVGGRLCDQCLPGYFGLTSVGCRKCDPCDVPGHFCDPKTGRCVCPPYTTGDSCQVCTPDAHGYNSESGCQPCNCNPTGSIDQKCDDVTGNCFCHKGFEGRHCDHCQFGYYQFPYCQRCDCDITGTDPNQCRFIEHDRRCQCDDRGNCPCKENVNGRNCDQCKENTFGMSSNNSKGCFECFCFGRTKNCHQATLSQSKLHVSGREVTFEVGNDEISTLQGFKVIHGQTENVIMHIPYVLDQPLYWNLPIELLGDKVSAYNGYIEYNVMSQSESHFPDAFLRRFPSIVLQGNYRLVLIHNLQSETSRGKHAVRFHEDEWQHYENPQTPVTRSVMMVALQNLQLILIRGTDGADVKFARLSGLSMQIANESSFRNAASSVGIEVCQCPPKYVGLSCQDPATGYYRKRKQNFLDSKDVLDLVGWAEPCNCNNRSKTCDRETGMCINCTNYSRGSNCEHCIKGFYEQLHTKQCLPCSCPLTTNRFSDTCHPEGSDYICVDCQPGYTGRHCERCSDGYYGNPLAIGGSCESCNCNPYGSRSQICDKTTGQCLCLEGLVSRDCSECHQRHILTEYGCKSCVDNCTGALFADLDYINDLLNKVDLRNLSAIPWGYLRLLENQTKTLKPPVNKYMKNIALGKQLVDNFTFHFDLKNKADDLYRKSRDTAAKASLVADDAGSILMQVNNLLDEIQKLRKELSDLVHQLESHGQDPSRPGSNIDQLLKQAQAILIELRDRDFIPKRRLAKEELRKAQDLLDRVKALTIDRQHLDELRDRLDMLELVLTSLLQRIEEDVRQPTNQALNIIRGTVGALEEVKDTIDRIMEIAGNASITLKDAAKILDQARNAVIDAAVKYEGLPRLMRDLENSTQELEHNYGILSRLNPLYKEQYVIPAQKHADDLQRQVDLYIRQFTATREVSEFPLKAAKAYQSIVDALEAAKKAAQEAYTAAEVAYMEAYPTRDDHEPLIKTALKAREHSIELLREAEQLRDKEVPELEELLDDNRKILEQVGEHLAQGQRNIAIIDRELDGLATGTHDLEQAEKKRKAAVLTTNLAKERTDAVEEKIEKVLLPGLEVIKTGSVGGLENLTKLIEQAKRDINNASETAGIVENAAYRIKDTYDSMQLNLKDLKDKILLARQKASSIRVSIGSNKKGYCKRSFKPEIEPTTTNSIVLNFAIKSEAQDSLLFFLGSSKELEPTNKFPDDFMAIEMVNRKIRFLWNAGGGTQVIQHNLTIETNDQHLLKNEQWYKIEVKRYGNIAVLSVKRTPDGQKPDPYEVTGVSPEGFSKMDLDSSSYFYIGGLPPNYKTPKELKSRSLAGCLYKVILDGKPVGLWNFQTNEGCEGCKEGATEDIDISAYRFKGDGYTIWPKIRRYNKNRFLVSFWFKTFDENTLLFMAPNIHNGHFTSLEIKEGKIVYRANLGGSSQFTIITSENYNTGQWTKVEASRQKLRGHLQVDDEHLEIEMQRGGSTSLDIQNSQIYYGGVPPNFTTSRWPGITFQNFLGCMRDVQIDATAIDLLKNPYGVEEGCIDRVIKVASFHGAGYLELKGQPLPQEASFGFSFLTRQRNALLLLSTFSGRTASAEKQNHYYSVAIVDGKLEVKVNSGGAEHQMSSDIVVNNGTYYTITIIKRNRKMMMRINDEEVSQLRLPRGVRDIEAPTDGGLYLGGVPEDITVGQAASTRTAFSGTIKDAIFNNRLLSFNEPIQFVGVGIGRTASVRKNAELEHAPMSDPRESCASKRPRYTEKMAVHFGILRDSFAKISVSKKMLSSHFNMEFDFRTHESNGLLLVSQHGRRKNYFALVIEEGHFVVDIQVKRISIKLSFANQVDDGKWHSISISFYKRVMNMTLDGNTKTGQVNVNKLPIKNLIYVGGTPSNFVLNKQLIKEKFQGCIRNLYLAGKQMTLMEDLPHGVTACITNIEPGVYFSNGAYVILDSTLLFKKRININFGFRTNQLSGTIMTIVAGSHTLSVSTEDGKVELIISVDGSSETTKLFHDFHSKYSICRNDWHNIVIDYSHGTISLKVNNMKTVEAKLKWSQHLKQKAQIYIGGHPEQHSLDFVGCIKKFRLNGMPISWSEASVHNILPCPAA